MPAQMSARQKQPHLFAEQFVDRRTASHQRLSVRNIAGNTRIARVRAQPVIEHLAGILEALLFDQVAGCLRGLVFPTPCALKPPMHSPNCASWGLCGRPC